jgi:hypothetical protein
MDDHQIRLVPTGRGSEVVEVGYPTHCANGHPLARNQTISFRPCSCSPGIRGHCSAKCRTCGDLWLAPRCLDEDHSVGKEYGR